MQGLSYTNVLAATLSRGNPDIAKVAVWMTWRVRAIVWVIVTMECTKLINTVARLSSRARPRTAFGLQAEAPVQKIRNSFPIIPPQVEVPRLCGATHLGSKCGVFLLLETWKPRVNGYVACLRLVIGSWNITELTGMWTDLGSYALFPWCCWHLLTL